MELSELEVEKLVRENKLLKKRLADRDKEILAREQAADLIVEGTNDVVFLFNPFERTILYVSSNLESTLGVSAEEVMNNPAAMDAVSEGLGAVFTDASLGNLRPGESRTRDLDCVNSRTGHRYLCTEQIVRFPQENPELFVCRLQDHTSEDSRNQKIREIISVSEKASRNRKEFLSNVSHDFRTPLNSIAGFVLLLMKSKDNPARVMELSHKISVSCQELLELINQFLDMDKFEAGIADLDSREFALGVLLDEINSTISAEAQTRHQQYVVRTEGIERDQFVGDPARISEILMNLLTNAVKYTPEGGHIELLVSGRSSDSRGRMALTFQVSDNGIGMTPEFQKTIFNPFDDSAARGKRSSTGLGMAITKKLVDLMGGEITVQSAPEAGSTFTVTLPLSVSKTQEDRFWEEHGIRRILLVDEDMEDADRIRRTLQDAGVSTDTITSGYGAIQMMDQGHMKDSSYELILIDSGLHGMDAATLTGKIRQMPWIGHPTLLLMLSEGDDPSTHQEKVDGTLIRPFFVSSLRNLIENLGLESEDEGQEEEIDANPMAGLRFLAAEDNTINADIIKELLEIQGARCEIAGNGKAAVAMFKNSKPDYYDMILMDIQMPIMDGYEATREIRALERQDARTVPILAMTANTFEADVQKSFDSGMNAHIAKPLDINILNTTVRKLRRSRKKRTA